MIPATINSELQVGSDESVNTASSVHIGLVIPARLGRPLRTVQWSGSALPLVLSRALGGHDHVLIHGMTPEAGLLSAWGSKDTDGAAENPRMRRLFGIPDRFPVRGNALVVRTTDDGRTVGLTDAEIARLREMLDGAS